MDIEWGFTLLNLLFPNFLYFWSITLSVENLKAMSVSTIRSEEGLLLWTLYESRSWVSSPSFLPLPLGGISLSLAQCWTDHVSPWVDSLGTSQSNRFPYFLGREHYLSYFQWRIFFLVWHSFAPVALYLPVLHFLKKYIYILLLNQESRGCGSTQAV